MLALSSQKGPHLGLGGEEEAGGLGGGLREGDAKESVEVVRPDLLDQVVGEGGEGGLARLREEAGVTCGAG